MKINTFNNRIIALSLAAICGCNKNNFEGPTFEVQAFATQAKGGSSANEFKVNDTIVFRFTGNPDNIVFYSGEAGKNHTYKDRGVSSITPSIPRFSFTSIRANSTQENTLALMISTDFNGSYDSMGIAAAAWTDISDRARISTGASTASGSISLQDFAAADKPVYLAFRFTGMKSTTPQPRWTITATNLTNTALPDSSLYNMADITNLGWFGINMKNPDAVWAPSSTQLVMNGGAANSEDNLDWLVTRKIDLNAVKPDVGVPLKNMSVRLDQYDTFRFTKAGTYTVTFVAFNDRTGKRQEIIRQMTINVIP